MRRLIIAISLALTVGTAFAFNPCTTNNGETICRPGVMPNLQSHGHLTINGTKIENTLISHGPTFITDALLAQVTIHGPLTVSDGRISKKLSVHGPVTISGTHINGLLDIYGPLTLEAATVTGSVYVKGALNISDATIWQTIDAYSAESTLSDTEIMTLIIHADAGQPVVHLKNCLVQGDIRFIGEHGLVKSDQETTIYGEISNGTLILSGSAPLDRPS